MKPHFTIIGSIINHLHVTTSKNGIEYCQLDIDSVWTGKDENNNLRDEKGTYRILFYNEKATMVFTSFKQGDMVEVDCSLSSTVSQGKNESGVGNQTFVNYSVTGFRIEKVRRYQAVQAPQQQFQAPSQQRASASQQRASASQQFQAPQWGNSSPNFDNIPF